MKRLAAVLLALPVFGLGCRDGSSLSFPSAPVVLISVDTLRADRLPAYGYAKVETPAIDALRKDGILFQNAYSQVPLTLPSHVTLFTGMLPSQHGVRDNLGYRVGESTETLPGFLKRAGYATGGAVSSVVLSRATGIARGFDFYEDNVEPTDFSQSLGRVQRDGARTAEKLAEWMGERREAPVFAFLHIFEPHTPYDPPEPHRSRYPDAYDGEVARADEIVGDLLKGLKESGLYDRAVILFLSDHGEGLDDHGEQEHGVLLYREAIHVPLILKLPGSRRAGTSVAAPVALTDVFPTVAALAGQRIPEGLAGRPLTAYLSGKPAERRRIFSETLYPRIHLGWSDLASLVDERFQYIEAPRPELYDLVEDPAEKRDLAASLPPAFRSMRVEIARLIQPFQPPGISDPEQVRKLAALGYISATTPDAKGDLPDPKDRVQAVEQLKRGFGHLQGNRFAEAAREFRKLLETDPRMTDVWQMLGQALLRLNRDAEALRAFQQAARLAPGNPQVLLGLMNFYVETGDYEQARAHAELARDAGAANGHENLARIAAAQGDMETAEREALAELKEYPERRIPHLILGRVRKQRGDLAGALAELELANAQGEQSRQPPLFGLNFLRGDVLARLGREREAETAFQLEIRDFPFSAQAWTALAVLHASQGREEQARRTLEELVARVQTPEAYFAASRTLEVLGDPESAAQLRKRGRRLFPEARERSDRSG
jgi:arylsulfatase A-like enzyme/Flp pilus assembly protein TadD